AVGDQGRSPTRSLQSSQGAARKLQRTGIHEGLAARSGHVLRKPSPSFIEPSKSHQGNHAIEFGGTKARGLAQALFSLLQRFLKPSISPQDQCVEEAIISGP